MKITKKQFLDAVRHEIDSIKNNATDFEKSLLDFDTLKTRDYTSCIYGQMTGYCFSERATELISQGCLIISSGISEGEDQTFSKLHVYFDTRNTGDYIYRSNAFSSIELYITLKNAKNANVIAYIKGETDKLIL